MRCASLAFAALALVGCASAPVGASRQLPPADLLQDCGTIPGKPKTNRELSLQRDALIADLEACNRDKARLREWAEDKP